MDKPSGTLVAFVEHHNGRRAIVDVNVETVCARCASGRGCGAGLLGGRGRVRQIEALLPQGVAVSTGDRVEITLQPRDVLHAAVAVYGLPLAGAVLAAGLAYFLDYSDAAGAVAALAGLAFGLLVSRWYLSRDHCLSRFVPTIERAVPRFCAGA